MQNNGWKTTYFRRTVWIVILAVIWQALALAKVFNPLIFPPLPTIFSTLWTSLMNGSLVQATFFSLWLIFQGLIIGIVLGLILVLMSMTGRTMAELIATLTAVAHPLPGIALLPLVILCLGAGTKAIVFIIVHAVLWPILVNLTTGFKATPRIYKEVGQNMRFNKIQTIRFILIPAALPHLLSGLKIGWARAWRALISAEMIFGAAGGIGGLGWFIFQRRVFMDSAGIYAGVIVIIIIGMVVEDLFFEKIEQATIRKWGISA